MNWAPARHPAARAARGVPAPVRGGRARRPALRSVMNAYNEIDGVPCARRPRAAHRRSCASEWGFEGCVVSDYFSIRQLAEYHRLAADGESAAAMALDAGLDVELPTTDCYGAPLLEALDVGARRRGDARRGGAPRAAGEVRARALRASRTSTPSGARAVADTPAHRELARTIARKSIVLLRNDGVLPLAAELGSIAVIGPNADAARNLFGDYAYPAHVESLREVLESGRSEPARRRSSSRRTIDAVELDAPSVRRRAARAARRDGGLRPPAARSTATRRDGFAEAVALAARGRRRGPGDGRQVRADRRLHERRVPRPRLARPSGRPGGARPRRARRRARRSCSCSSPAGRAASAWLHERCAAVLLAWLPGEEGGAGDRRRPDRRRRPRRQAPDLVSRAASARCRSSTAHKVSGGRSHWKGDYVDLPVDARSTRSATASATRRFELSERGGPRRDRAAGTRRSTSTSRSRTPATGAGDEVVQLYVRDPQASVTRPDARAEELRARRARRRASRSASRFDVPVGQLGFYDRELALRRRAGHVRGLRRHLVATCSTPARSTVVADSIGDAAGEGLRRVGHGRLSERA